MARAQQGTLLTNNLPSILLQRQPDDLGWEIGPEGDVAKGSARSVVGVIGNEHILTGEHSLKSGRQSSSGGGVHGNAVGHVHHCAGFCAEDLVGLQADGDNLTFFSLNRTGSIKIDWNADNAIGAGERILARFYGR